MISGCALSGTNDDATHLPSQDEEKKKVVPESPTVKADPTPALTPIPPPVTTPIPIITTLSLTPEEIEAWAIGCSVILSVVSYGRNPYKFGMYEMSGESARDARETLSSAWGIRNRDGLLESVEGLINGGINDYFLMHYDVISFMSDDEFDMLLEESDEFEKYMWGLTKIIGDGWGDKQIKAWDWFRVIHLAGWAYISEIIELDEAYLLMESAILLLRSTFTSWDEAYDNYMDGYAWWSQTDITEAWTEYQYRLAIYDFFRNDKFLFNQSVWTQDFMPSPTSGFAYVDNGDGTCSVRGFVGEAYGDLVIPDEIDGLTVTSIGHMDEDGNRFEIVGFDFTNFKGFDGSLTLPDSLEIIGIDAFNESGISGHVVIPEGVTHIGNTAFAFCDNITQVLFPGSLIYVGRLAFYGCQNLRQAEFLGDAPRIFLDGVFEFTHNDFRILYDQSKRNWTSPRWNGYHCLPR